MLSEDYENPELMKINKQLYAFIRKNKKEYMNKVISSKWSIYEYKDYYELFVNDRKTNILEEVSQIFPKKVIIRVEIDGKERSLDKLIPEDFKYSNSAKIIIAK